MRADVGTPPYVVSQGAIGPGRNQDAFLKAVRDTDDEGEVNETFFSRGGVLLYTISYQDVFETQFPRKRRLTGKDLGHIQPEVF